MSMLTVKSNTAAGQPLRCLHHYAGLHGRLLVNYFNRFGRQWQTYVEAEGDYRTNVNNIGQFLTSLAPNGSRVPLALSLHTPRYWSEFTMRFNEYEAAQD